MTSSLVVVAGLLALVGALLLLAGVVALFRARLLAFAVRVLLGLVLILLGSTLGLVSLGMHGYRALTHEEVAARVVLEPQGRQQFTAHVIFPDGRQAVFDVKGDEIYIDAHILKWKPLANLAGLRTAYELDRLAGRYRDLGQERSAERTIYPLGRHQEVDLFDLRSRYAFLAPLFDAEYGSATFVPVTQRSELELRVSSTGLLVRPVPESSR